LILGNILGVAARNGRDKITMITSPGIGDLAFDRRRMLLLTELALGTLPEPEAVAGLSISRAPRRNVQKAGRLIQGEDPHTVLPEKRFWTHVAVQLASIYATLACINYVVQLATVLPAGYSWTVTDQTGTPGPLSVLNQTPHSLMWDLDGLAYIFLNLSTLFAAMAFERQGPERVIRIRIAERIPQRPKPIDIAVMHPEHRIVRGPRDLASQ
jgi:hypothetical protein